MKTFQNKRQRSYHLKQMQDQEQPTYKMKYKLINQFDGNDSIEFEASEDEDPCSVALEQLGWTLVASKDEDES